jgi:hypothetical protein
MLTQPLPFAIYEPSFDTFHKNKDRIYRAVTSAEYDNLENKWGVSPNLPTPTIRKKIHYESYNTLKMVQ